MSLFLTMLTMPLDARKKKTTFPPTTSPSVQVLPQGAPQQVQSTQLPIVPGNVDPALQQKIEQTQQQMAETKAKIVQAEEELKELNVKLAQVSGSAPPPSSVPTVGTPQRVEVENQNTKSRKRKRHR